MPSKTDTIEDSGVWPEVERLVAPHREAISAAHKLAEAEMRPITDNETLAAANLRQRELRTFSREIEAARKSATAPIMAQKFAADSTFNAATAHLDDAFGAIDKDVQHYMMAQRRIREAAEEKARQEAEAERRRKERLAAAAEAKGNHDRAIEHAEAAARVEVKPVAVPEPPKLDGLSQRTTWRAVITDHAAVPREFCVPDQAKLDKLAKALGAEMNVPGVRAESSTTTVARSI